MPASPMGIIWTQEVLRLRTSAKVIETIKNYCLKIALCIDALLRKQTISATLYLYLWIQKKSVAIKCKVFWDTL